MTFELTMYMYKAKEKWLFIRVLLCTCVHCMLPKTSGIYVHLCIVEAVAPAIVEFKWLVGVVIVCALSTEYRVHHLEVYMYM